MPSERWSPFREALTLRDAMDRLFQESIVRPTGWVGPGANWFPMDVAERENEYEVRVALPGWRPEEIDVSVQGDTVTISGERKAAPEAETGTTYHVRERSFAAFSRSFAFPTAVDADQATAAFEHGELTLRIPKATSARPRRIAIGAGQAGQIGAGQAGQVGSPPS
jgi:HSP20 family protein